MPSDGFEWMDEQSHTTRGSRRRWTDGGGGMEEVARLRERVRQLQGQLDEAQLRAAAIDAASLSWTPSVAASPRGVLGGLAREALRGMGRARSVLGPLALQLASSSPRRLVERAGAQLALGLMTRARDVLDRAIAART
jgi:hypothetical protein